MKKLLALLGAVSLTATGGLAIVSCSTKEDPVVPPTGPTFEETLALFKQDLNSINRDVISDNENNSKLTRIVDGEDNSSYEFLNLKHLKDKYEHTSQENNQKWTLGSDAEAKAILAKDIKRLYPDDQFSKLIEKTIATNPEYRKIYMSSANQTLGNFVIAETGFILESTLYNVNENEEKEQVYTVSFTFSREMFYKNKEEQKEMMTTVETPIRVVIGETGAIMSIISDVAETLPTTIYESKTFNTQMKYSEIISKYDKQFKKYGYLDNAMSSVANDTNFTKSLQTEVQNIIGKQFTSTVKFDGDVTTPKEVSVSDILFGKNNDFKQTEVLFDESKNALFNSFFLKAASTESMSSEEVVPELQQLFKGMENEVPKFNEDLSVFLTEFAPNLTELEQTTIVDNTYTYGKFAISSMSIQISNSGAELEDILLPTIQVPWTYINDSTSRSKSEAYFEEMYNAIVLMNQKYFFQANPNAAERSNTYFDLIDNVVGEEILTKLQYKGTQPTVEEWKEILNNPENVDGVRMMDTNTRVRLHEHKRYRESVLQDPGYAFTSVEAFVNIYDTESKDAFRLKKNSNGDIGIGLNTGNVEKKTYDIDFKVNIGRTRIQAKITNRSKIVNGEYDGSRLPETAVRDKDFLGLGRTKAEFYNEINNNPDFLFFTLISGSK